MQSESAAECGPELQRLDHSATDVYVIEHYDSADDEHDSRDDDATWNDVDR